VRKRHKIAAAQLTALVFGLSIGIPVTWVVISDPSHMAFYIAGCVFSTLIALVVFRWLCGRPILGRA
jgi:hypothetical protein